MTGKRKDREPTIQNDSSNGVTDDVGDLLLEHLSGDEESGDSTDSEESVYSGLEEEETSSSENENQKMAENSDEDESDVSEEQQEEDDKDKDEKDTPGTSTTIQKTYDEYEHDTSDEEDIRNTVGNIPMEWYRDFKHIGYTVDGKKIIKPKKGDELDNFLKRMDDPNYWRTVTNEMTGQDILLSEEDLRTIQRIQAGKYPSSSTETYEPWVDFFSSEVMIHPLTNRPEHKRSFIPSKWERLKVGQMVHALKMGWMKPSSEKKEEDNEPKYYQLWKDDEETEITRRYRQHIPAPKLSLPGHEESYNPPPEYLFTKEEEDAWKEKEPEERRINFIPQKYSSLRLVPAYSRFINERFERCLDLYLCPRQRKMRMNVNPDDLIPKLPKPRELQPFPTTQAMVYEGHSDMVRCISVDPSGQWLASGSDDQTVRLWEIATGRCMKTLKLGGVVKSLTWNPNSSVCLIAVTVESSVILLNPHLGDKLLYTATDNMLANFTKEEEEPNKAPPTTWTRCTGEEYESGLRLRVMHPKDVKQVTWHGKGDYFASVMPQGESMSVLIHQLSKQRSQNPFSKSKGLVQCVLFHPIRPFLFVATQRYVRVYNLLKQELSKKLMTNCKWVSSMAVHHAGDNVIVGSYDCKLSWFDLDLSTKPYHTLRHHKKALRQVAYHKKYPLFASASDDGAVIVCHGMVYNDLLQNPLIVPVKVLRGHQTSKGLSVLDCVFHPSQPWVFSSGADTTIRLFT
ncbi:ribosome biogenesis protein bop1-like [Liolophura sinensis]|uniref:ribosome biogenesis protein bop1-like n=1 Tax=Liolophura sinensis TaxID=3198878 RepID=UPI003158B18E